jgi:hypothetical protein
MGTIEVGDLVRVTNPMLGVTVGKVFNGIYRVRAIDHEPNLQGRPGPWLDVEGIHPIVLSPRDVLRAAHISCFEKVEDLGLVKAEKPIEFDFIGRVPGLDVDDDEEDEEDEDRAAADFVDELFDYKIRVKVDDKGRIDPASDVKLRQVLSPPVYYYFMLQCRNHPGETIVLQFGTKDIGNAS